MNRLAVADTGFSVYLTILKEEQANPELVFMALDILVSVVNKQPGPRGILPWER